MTVTRDMFGARVIITYRTHTEQVRIGRSGASGRCLFDVSNGSSIAAATLDPDDAIELARWIIDTFGADSP